MSAYNQSHAMLVMVAKALGNDLLKEVAFLGGCTTGLFITDETSRESVRYTEDVDLITHVIGYPDWIQFQNRVKQRGFKESMEYDINCRMRLDNLIVDFMPDDEKILGYSNRWYQEALKESHSYILQDNLSIQLVTPAYFIATKLEAYNGRGKGNLLHSRDIEDILMIFDGRGEINDEINRASMGLKNFISEELDQLLRHQDFEYAIQSTAKGQTDREELIFNRLELTLT